MQTAKSGSHTIWDCKYHLVWVTKYRYPVLVGDVGLRARELLREISRSHEMSIHAGAINRDHVHLLLSIPPHLSVSRAVQYLKGKSSHKLLTEYPSLRKRYWGQHLWSRGAPVALGARIISANGMQAPTNRGRGDEFFQLEPEDERGETRRPCQAARSIRVGCQFHGSRAARSLIL